MKNLKKPARLPRKAPSNQTGGTAWGKKLAAEISRMAQAADMKKLILLNFPYIIAFYMVEKAAWLYRHCNGDSVVDRLMVLFMNFGLAYKSVLPSFHPFDLMVGLVGAAALKAVIYFKGKNAKKYRQGKEYGSARWGNQKDIEPFIDPVFENNVILTQTERLMMSGRPKHNHSQKLLSFRYNIDTNRVEARFTDGSAVANRMPNCLRTSSTRYFTVGLTRRIECHRFFMATAENHCNVFCVTNWSSE